MNVLIYRVGCLFFLMVCLLQAQEYILNGKITDEKNQALPFASLYFENSNIGTNANESGDFFFKLAPGKYKLIVQYIGYKKKEIELNIYQSQTINISLMPENITFKEVNVHAKEDPAYIVIRNAIKTRKRHRRELYSHAYHNDVYIKGMQKLLDIPAKIFGMEVQINDNDKGVFYLSETKSVFYFTPPDHKKEIIKASRVSGQSKGFSFNRYIPMQKDIYDNTFDFYFIANKPFISPIAENALLFYKYKMHGTFFEDGKMINKIEVIPKSSTEPCFRGMIYIEENSWRIHSFDFYVTKEAKLNFIDTLWFKQINSKIYDSLYYPNSIQYVFNFNIFGIKGSGYFIASVSNYAFNADTLTQNFSKNEMVRFEKDAIKNDSDYWNKIRPIPLSEEEKKDYIKKDGIEKITSSKNYLDSLDKKNNRLTLGKLLMGYKYQNTYKNKTFRIDGLLTAGVQYNTIEGINISLHTQYEQASFDKTKKFYWENYVRYGIANHLPGLKSNIEYHDHPFNFRKYGISAQYYVEPFNHQYSIPEVVNTFYTLLDYRNYLKYYLKKSLKAFYYQEIFNGLYVNFNTSFEERTALNNTYALKIFKHKNYFTSNDPLYPFNDNSPFHTHQAMILDVQLKYNIAQKYTTYPDHKHVWHNKYPELSVQYTKAIPLNNNMINYDLIQAAVQDKIEFNYWGYLNYYINGGYFLNNQKMYFMDYVHFPANQTNILYEWNAFRLLNYYNYSTNQYFLQAHTEYNLKGIITGRIPFMKKFKLEEIITAHYLYNPLLKNYYELSFGLDKLFYVLRIEYALAYYPFMSKPVNGFLIGTKILFNN